MFTDYISPSKDTPSRSGLYANGLPGVTLNLLDDLTKDEQEDFLEFWEDIYNRTIINFVGDVQGKLADKFLIDLKLLSRETSKFETDDNAGSGNAGIKLEYSLPKYGVLHVMTIEVFSDSVQSGITFTFYDTNESGRVLYTSEDNDLVEGINIIYVDQDFSVDKLFIGYDRSAVTLRQTRNRYFDSGYYFSFNEITCSFPCYNNSEGKVTQIDGGGINVIYNATCSIRKFVEDNLNIFKEAFWYRIGLELIRERIFSDRFNRWTTMQPEDAEKKEGAYAKECELKLSNAIRSLRMTEDPICFACKSTVSSTYIIP
jgi:hypothetical protein